MSQELTVYRELSQIAESLQKAGTLPPELRGKVDDLRLIAYTGHELGLKPAAAIRSIHIIKGKPVLSADLMVAIVLRSGLAEYFQCVSSDERHATYRTHRKGNPTPDEMTFSIDDAKRAQLVQRGGNWEKYPRRMLQHRAASTLARLVYPDVLAGCYTPDESHEFGGNDTSTVIDAEVVDERPEDVQAQEKSLFDTLHDALSTSRSRAELDAAGARVAKAKDQLTKEQLVQLRAVVRNVEMALKEDEQ